MAAKDKKVIISDEVLKVYDDIIKGFEGIERKGATMPYTSLNGHMFSFIAADGSLSLRLPKESREAFIKKYKTVLAEAHGVILKEYVVVPPKLFKDVKAMKLYFKISCDHIRSLRPKPAK